MSKKPGGFWSGKRVLVTGYEGFLGAKLTENLLDLGARIVGLDKIYRRPNSPLNSKNAHLERVKGNLANFSLIYRLFIQARPEVIFHLAAQAIVPTANKNPLEAFKSNIQGTWNMLEAARRTDFKGALIVASSDKAYGDHEHLPYTENACLKGAHPYDVSKSCADLLAQAYFRTYRLSVAVTRCGNIYGPGDFHFSRIVPEAIHQALRGKKMLIRSDGTFTRDYIFVDDVVSGYLAVARKFTVKKCAGEAFNFSNEKPLSVLELVKLIYQLCGQEPKYTILNQASGEIKHQYLSAHKARTVLGWQPRYTLEEGLKKTIRWYQEAENSSGKINI